MNSHGSARSKLRISVVDMMDLHVRTESARPDFLYQRLPMHATGLLATLPRGDFAVSIPHELRPGKGYLIQRTFSASHEGPVIIYSLQPNRRYEAIEVSYRGGKFGLPEFCDLSERWAKTTWGRLKVIPGQYFDLNPAPEQWASILRDNGYSVSDLFMRSPDDASKPSGGMWIRLPLQTGEKQPPGSTVPAFTRVEVNPDISSADHWMSFDEFKAIREAQSRPPASLLPDLQEWVVRLTAESGFESWVFAEGTLFGDRVEWWGDRNRRRTEHEGIDFSRGQMSDGSIRQISEGTPIRAALDGEVAAKLSDFINETVAVRHPGIGDGHRRVLYTFYSHLEPEHALAGTIRQGQIIGRIEKSKSLHAPVHLHWTAAWIPESINPDEIKLDHIHPGFMPVVLIDLNSLVRT
jgi:murein DD-endopeptidase MepM/ murein hydrolase activator NlpD